MSDNRRLTGRPIVLAGGDWWEQKSIGGILAGHGENVVLVGHWSTNPTQARDLDLPCYSIPTIESLPRLARQIVDEQGVPKGVVTLPGLLQRTAGSRLSGAMWRAGFEAELLLPAQLWNAFVPAMSAEGGGSLLALTTPDVVQAYPGRALHSALRSALAGLVRVLAVELAPIGIRANLLVGILGVSGKPAALRTRIPTGAPPSDADLAAGISFLVDDATFMTGQALRVDGGWATVDWVLDPALVAPIEVLPDEG